MTYGPGTNRCYNSVFARRIRTSVSVEGQVFVFGTGVPSFFFQAEDGIRDLVRSRGLGDVYKRQVVGLTRPMLIGNGGRSFGSSIVGYLLWFYS